MGEIEVSVLVERRTVARDQPMALFVVLRLRASGASVEATRAPLSTVLLLDISGSMAGPKLAGLQSSVEKLLDLCRPSDKLGLVAFSDSASVVLPLTFMDGSGKRLGATRTRRLFADGGTNIQDGLEIAIAALQADKPEPESGPRPIRRHGTLLLSDGAPNRGLSTAAALGALVSERKQRISISTLGYGADHNEDVLDAIATAGGGKFQFISDPAICTRELASALGSQVDVVADGIDLEFGVPAGVEIRRFVGDPKVRFTGGGPVLAVPDMEDEAERIVALEVTCARPPASGELFRVRVRYSDAGKSEKREKEVPIAVKLSDRAGDLDPEAHSAWLLARCEEERKKARAVADRGDFNGAAAILRAMLTEIERSPAYVVGSATPLFEAHELVLDEAVALERNPSREAYSVFRKQTIMQKLDGGSAIRVNPKKGATSQRFSERTAGAAKGGRVLVMTGPGAGTLHVLGEHCSIGRTRGADIVVFSAQISRRHAEIYALEGDYWVCDLGSTNPTMVNGVRLGTAPVKLAHLDVIRVGDVDLRFEWVN